MTNRIKFKTDQINNKIAQLQALKTKLIARQTMASRALETRKKIILGGLVLANHPDLVPELVANLTRPQDRAAFNLDAQPSQTSLDANFATNSGN